MSRARILLIWLVTLSAQLALAPLLRWFQGFPDLYFLAWASLLHDLHGRDLWAWTLIWAAGLGWVSAQPFWLPFLTYGLMAWIWRGIIQHWSRAWALLYLAIVMVGTLWIHLATYALRLAQGVPMPWRTSLALVVAPSLFWNLILAFPIWALVHLGERPRYGGREP